ncbi:17462_t:CDS:1 [Acaulospora morrowiae]|uniref:17462_t:CDS:1 n=1 Tax=Acaulospora morrowiae TaxID=94023 RepID=A0A9N9D4V0_9GLOM|nr:17462_t:CDS:1 [Acaulospora morrowiae]
MKKSPFCFRFFGTRSVQKVSTSGSKQILNSECLQHVFLFLTDDNRALHSCLFINKFWSRNVIPVLWKCPFRRWNLSSNNDYLQSGASSQNYLPSNRSSSQSHFSQNRSSSQSHFSQNQTVQDDNSPSRSITKLLLVYLLCLEKNERKILKNALKTAKVKFPKPKFRSTYYHYATYLQDLSLRNLEHAVIILLRSLSKRNNKNKGNNMKFQIEFLTTTLFKLFLRQATNLHTLTIDKFLEFTDIPGTSVFSIPACLSRVEKFELIFHKTPNFLLLLQTLPSICTSIRNLSITFPPAADIGNEATDLESDIMIGDSLSNIIKSQMNLREFHLKGGNSVIEKLFSSLQCQFKSLRTLEFNSVNLSGASLRYLSACQTLKSLTLWNCQGFSMNEAKSLVSSKYRLRELRLWSSRKSPGVTATIIKHVGRTVKKLWVDVLSLETIHAISNYCPIVTDVRILDYLPKQHPFLVRLLKETRIERLTISREMNVGPGVINLIGQDLPEELKYLKLDCGVDVKQLEDLLYGCKCELKILIVKYFKVELAHLKVISEFAKSQKSLRVIGVGGKQEYSEKELLELKMMRENYGIFIIPLSELDFW